MLQLDVIQGSQTDFVVAAKNRDSSVPTGFLSTDTLTSSVWGGQNLAPLFSPAATWSDFTVGDVALSFTGANTSTLDYAGTYHGNVSATRSGVTAVILDFVVRILAAPGVGTQTTVPYCTLANMLEHAPWLTMIQDDDTGVEGYYPQRLEAKTWFDWLIVRSWRGTSTALFGDPGRSASQWSGSFAGRTPLPSQWLINQLSGGIVINPITLATQGSGYTFANVVFSGGGPNAIQATAFAIVSGGQVISSQLIQSGTGYTSTPTITITGDGTGATATCAISANVLILRPQIIRVCALKAASIVGLGQIGRMNNIASFGAFWRDMASSEAVTCVAELDQTGNGIADLAIPLGSTNTLFS
jgi:hypothetical protein